MSEMLGQDAAAEKILSMLGDDGESEPAVTESPENSVDTESEKPQITPNAQVQGADDTASEGEPESPTPAIEPPASWKAEAKDLFGKLPPDLQKYVSERESERDRGLSEAQRKSAEAAKGIESLQGSVDAERKANVEKLRTFVNYALVNPQLAEWTNRNWEQYSRENPLEAQSEWFAYQRTMNAINQADQERQRLENESLAERRRKAHEVLSKDLDFWNDESKRQEFQKELSQYLLSQGYTQQQLEQIDDPSTIKQLRKAMLHDKREAELAAIAAKKVPQTTPQGRTMRATSNETSNANPRAESLRAKARRTGRVDDIAEAVLATIQ